MHFGLNFFYGVFMTTMYNVWESTKHACFDINIFQVLVRSVVFTDTYFIGVNWCEHNPVNVRYPQKVWKLF